MPPAPFGVDGMIHLREHPRKLGHRLRVVGAGHDVDPIAAAHEAAKEAIVQFLDAQISRQLLA